MISGKWFILPLGFVLFVGSDLIAQWTLDHLGHEITPEPLLMCITAG